MHRQVTGSDSLYGGFSIPEGSGAELSRSIAKRDDDAVRKDSVGARGSVFTKDSAGVRGSRSDSALMRDYKHSPQPLLGNCGRVYA